MIYHHHQARSHRRAEGAIVLPTICQRNKNYFSKNFVDLHKSALNTRQSL